jgi:peptidoglycan/LPS O-acetylase OafA/YrhL
LAWLWLFPKDLKKFTDSILAVIFFLSNHLFSNQSNYFDTATELKPLLHTWSLAVEEQYYLLFPLILMATWKLGQRWVLLMLTVLIVSSLLLAQWMSSAKPELGFYILPTRAWELLIGGLVAWYFTQAKRQEFSASLNQGGSLLGLALLIYAVLAFDKQTPFPSFYTLVPTVGSALIILCANPGTLVGRLLGHRILVGIGLISYSAYLWHQPLFAFTRYRYLDHPGQLLLGALAVLAFALGYLTWRFVETPFRDKQRFTRRQIFTYSAIGSIFFITIGVVSNINKGFSQRITDEQKEVLMYDSGDLLNNLYVNIYKRGTCFLDSSKTAQDFNSECLSNNPSESVLIWGDSHAAALSFGVRQHFEKVSQYNSAACPPLINLDVQNSPNCESINDFVIKQVAKHPPKIILLHANWVIYKKYNIAAQLVKTIETLKIAAPQSKIMVIGSVPQWEGSLPATLISKNIGLSQEWHLVNIGLPKLKALDTNIAAITQSLEVKFLSPIDVMCQEGKCLATTSYDGKIHLTAWDYGHLTEAGSVLLAQRLFTKE